MKRLKRYWTFYWMFGLKTLWVCTRPIEYVVLDVGADMILTLLLFPKGRRNDILVGDCLSRESASFASAWVTELVKREVGSWMVEMKVKFYKPIPKRGVLYHALLPVHYHSVLPRARRKHTWRKNT